MANGKWIEGLTPQTPVTDAAVRVLRTRLDVVAAWLPRAVKEAYDDPEHVHQLRVSTRRAGAALAIFASCLPEKIFRATKKRLRQLRRAAGAARDWDVFLIHLAEWGHRRPASFRPGLDCLLGHAMSQRLMAQDHLVEAGTRALAKFDHLRTETIAAIRAPQTKPPVSDLIDLARSVLAGLLQELELAVTRDLSNYDNLHQVRIAGKRLRYAMEIFGDCFPPVFRQQHYAAVEEMQEILGRANDSHVASQRLTLLRQTFPQLSGGEWKRLKPGIEGLLRYHQRRLPAERQLFEKWWLHWQASDNAIGLRSLLELSAAPLLRRQATLHKATLRHFSDRELPRSRRSRARPECGDGGGRSSRRSPATAAGGPAHWRSGWQGRAGRWPLAAWDLAGRQ
jgi:CHAD domain-containing protein